MIPTPYQALVAVTLLTLCRVSQADSNTYGQYMSQITQQRQDMKPLTNSQFFVSNATNRANKDLLRSTSGNNQHVIKGVSDGGANVDSVNIGPNSRLDNATIIVQSNHSNSTIVSKNPANR